MWILRISAGGEAPFGYTYTKDDKIKNIYLMHHNQIKQQKPRTYKGVYKKRVTK